MESNPQPDLEEKIKKNVFLIPPMYPHSFSKALEKLLGETIENWIFALSPQNQAPANVKLNGKSFYFLRGLGNYIPYTRESK